MRNETIKLSEVKTMEQLNVVSDRWYNRADYLKSIWQDPEQSARNQITRARAANRIAVFSIVPWVFWRLQLQGQSRT